MFARRHPYLFFVLIFTFITSLTLIVVGGMVVTVVHSTSDGPPSDDAVGIVEVSGMITDSKAVLDDLKRMRETETVRAVVLRIDSPGGVVAPSQEIYQAVRKTSAQKKVIASLGAVAASGGYYIAAATDGIVASPGTITGSIGVILGYTNFKELLEKIGLTPVVVKSGRFKDLGSPLRTMSLEEKEILQQLSDQIHHQFIRDVAAGRGLEEENVAALADGRIYTGEAARGLGLVDRLGNLEDAVAWAGRLAGLESPVATVYARQERFSLMELVFGSEMEEFSGLAKLLGLLAMGERPVAR